MHADKTRAAIVAELEACVLHAERSEQMVAKIGLKVLATDLFDRLSDPVDVDAIVPFLAGVELERCGERKVLAGNDARNPLLLLVSDEIVAPDVVAKHSGMGEQLAQRDRSFGRTQFRLARRIETLEHLR